MKQSSFPFLPEIEIEEGKGLVGIEDALEERIVEIRKEVALDLGFVLPKVKIGVRDDLPEDGYAIRIKGNRISSRRVKSYECQSLKDNWLNQEVEVGKEESKSAFGNTTKWTEPEKKGKSEKGNHLVENPADVISRHLKDVIKRHAGDLLGRDDVRRLIDNIKKDHEVVCDELIPGLLTLGEVRGVLVNLLKEGVSIRNLPLILEVLADNAPRSKDLRFLTEQCRVALGREIVGRYETQGRLQVITMDTGLEDSIRNSPINGERLVLDPETAKKLKSALIEEVDRVVKLGHTPIVLCSREVRWHIKKFTEHILPDLVVLSWDEIPPDVKVESIGEIKL